MQLFLTEVTSKMASNEYVIPEHYEDLTPAPQLDQKTLNKMAWRSCFLQASFNYEAAVLYAEKHGANSVGVNCCSLAAANAAVPRMVASATTPVTVRPNVGDPVQTQDGPVWHENPEAFARACIEWRHAGVAMVGSCCGTTAITTAAMAEALDI